MSAASIPPLDIPPFDVVFGASASMRAVWERVERAASTSAPVLILGESGTGKDVLARIVHRTSAYRPRPFVKVNCAAIPAPLIESELFGYERGAFTGAYTTKPGTIEQAQGGTLFLDEIADLDLYVQAKLLHVLQDGAFARIGGRETLNIEFRLITATGKDLHQELAAGTFRPDLYYRINVVSIELPPLRRRTADIPQIVEYFLKRYRNEYRRSASALKPRTMELLMQYPWPGNIRELENLVRRYVILGSEQALVEELLEAGAKTDTVPFEPGLSLKARTREAVRRIERQIILDVLRANNWNRKEAARTLQISYRSLFYKLKLAGLPPKRAQLQRGNKSAERNVPENSGNQHEDTLAGPATVGVAAVRGQA